MPKSQTSEKTKRVEMPRLVRALTGITPRTRDRIMRMIVNLEDALDENGLVLFSGNCTDSAILLHKKTGIALGHVHGLGVFMGGDLPLRYSADGIEYSRDISPTSGDFVNAADINKEDLSESHD